MSNSATVQLEVTKDYLVGCKCGEVSNKFLTEAAEIVKALEILAKLWNKQVRNKKKRQFESEVQEKVQQNLKQEVEAN